MSICSYAFQYCKSLTSIIIPNSVESIGEDAFFYCDSITNIDIPDSVMSIGSYAFQYCRSLTSIIIPDGVMSIGGYAFQYCYSLTIYCESKNEPSSWSYYWNAETRPVVWGYKQPSEGLKYAINSTEDAYTVTGIGDCIDTDIVIPSTYNDLPVVAIGNNAFDRCSSLTSVTIGDGVTSIGFGAFEGCSSLTSVTIPASVTIIRYDSFLQCDSLQATHIADLAAWCNIDRDFDDMNDYLTKHLYLNGEPITDIVIPDGITGIPNRAFYDCSSLTSVTIPDSVTVIGYATFAGCSSLTSITIPDSVEFIGFSTFSGCSSLKSIIIPDGVTWIGDYAFKGCSSLTIYCEAKSKRSGWYLYWNYSNCPVVWGYKGG